MDSNFNIGISFRSLANIEQAFIYYLNCMHKRTLEFDRLRTVDYAFAFGLSEEEFEKEIGRFLSCFFDRVEPVEEAVAAVATLNNCYPDIFVIADLPTSLQGAISGWLALSFENWQPTVLHASPSPKSVLEATGNWEECQTETDLCSMHELRFFITENPIHAQLVACGLEKDIRTLLLRRPCNRGRQPLGVLSFPDWSSIVTEIYIRARG
jgi:hypothetical protein